MYYVTNVPNYLGLALNIVISINVFSILVYFIVGAIEHLLGIGAL
jgi:hypothetical protein